MSRRCKAGQRARFLRTSNAGKIVVVVRRYFGEAVSGSVWPLAVYPWVVTSLSAPLRAVFLHNNQPAPPAMTIVADDRDLEPLDDDDSGFDTDEQIRDAVPAKVDQLATGK